MGKRLLKKVGYLFSPEESLEGQRPVAIWLPAGRKNFAGVSFKAVFWACMAVATALLLGRLS